jgi:hypothetical protein
MPPVLLPLAARLGDGIKRQRGSHEAELRPLSQTSSPVCHPSSDPGRVLPNWYELREGWLIGLQTLRPGAVVAEIWQIYRDQIAVLIGTALVLFGLEFVVVLLVPGASVAVAILFWALNTLYQGMVVTLVQDVQDGRRDHSVGALLRSVEPVLLPLMGVSILFAIGVGIGFVLLIIPGLILLVMWSVVAPVTVLERPGVFAAFGRSRELVRGNGWAVFSVIVLVYLAVLIISLAAGLASVSLGSLGRALVQWAVNAAIAPISALSAAVLYFILRRQPTEPI